jgi:hypothetical protein
MYSSVILKCFMGVDGDQFKIKDEKLALFFLHLLDRVGKAASSLPVLLFGKYAYLWSMTKNLKSIYQDFTLLHKICMKMISDKR